MPSQEGGSSSHQVTQGRAGKQPAPNPSAGPASPGKLAGSRNYPLKTHLKWKNRLGIISRLFFRLANATNVFLGKKTQTSRAAGQPGSICREQPPRPALSQGLTSWAILSKASFHSGKLGLSPAMHFNICLTLYTAAATNSDVSPVLPTSLLICFSAQKSPISQTFFFFFGLLVQPPSLKKMAHAAQGICWISTSSCKRNPMENTRSFHVKSNFITHGRYKKSTVVLEPSLAKCPRIEDRGGDWRAPPAGADSLLQWGPLAACRPGLAAPCGTWSNPVPRVKPSSVPKTHTKPPPRHGVGGQRTTVGRDCTTGHEFHSQIKRPNPEMRLRVPARRYWWQTSNGQNTPWACICKERKKKQGKLPLFHYYEGMFYCFFFLVSFYSCSPLAQGILCITRFN